MIINFDPWIYGKLTTALSTAARVDYWYPNDFVNLPAVAYHSTQRNSDMDYQDDFAQYTDVTVMLDVYVTQATDDYSIVSTISTLMASLFFNLDMCEPVPDPDSKVLHRALTFSRSGMNATDLV